MLGFNKLYYFFKSQTCYLSFPKPQFEKHFFKRDYGFLDLKKKQYRFCFSDSIDVIAYWVLQYAHFLYNP